MKILITGISGFVGPHLRHELETNGHEVVGLDRIASGDTVFACDLTNTDAVLQSVDAQKPDAIAHLAALTSVKESWNNPDEYFSRNSEMTRNVLRAAQAANNKIRVLVTSSSDVYGHQKKFPITEEATPNPQNPYAKSKLAQEKVAKEFSGSKVLISRSFNHTGPGASDALVVGAFAKQIALCEKEKQDILRVGNLEASRDFLDVRDVVHAYRLLIERGRAGNIYNICSGTPRKIQLILGYLLSLSSKEIQVTADPDRMRPSDVPEFWGSYKKINQETGWKPKIPFEQTLRDTLDYWRETI